MTGSLKLNTAFIKANAKMFKHPEDPNKSAFLTCPAGWGCQIISEHIYKAYERGQPWFGCYWAPTAVLGKYKMVKVDLESGIDQEHFTSCLTQEICEDPKPSMYPPSPVKTIVVESFVQRVSEGEFA